MIYDNLAMANGFRRRQTTMKFGRPNVTRDVTFARGNPLDNSRQAALGPVDHLSGNMVLKCLDRIQILVDERDQFMNKVQGLAHQIGVDVPRDDPLAALDVIGQRYRELSARCHHKPTGTNQMTAPQQRADQVEAIESRDRDIESHVVQNHHGCHHTNQGDFGELPCASPYPRTSQPRHAIPPLSAIMPHPVTLPPSDTPCPTSPIPEWFNCSPSSASFSFGTMPTSPLIYHSSQPRHATPPPTAMPHPVTLPPSDTITPPLPTPEWFTCSPIRASFTFRTMHTPPLTYPSFQPRHPTPPPTAMPHPVTLPPSDSMTPPLPTPEWFTSSPRPITVGSQHRGRTPSPVLGAVGGQVTPFAAGASPAPPKTAITVWDIGQLSPFDRSKGDIVLGKGSYGTVKLFREKSTGTPLAVKIFTLPSDTDQMVWRVQGIQDEANVQAVLGCQSYFPTYHGCIEVEVGKVGMVMEFIGDRDTGETMPLGKVLYTGMPALAKKDWFSVANNLLQAVKFVHDKGYLLNDLKEDNVLLSRSDRGWRAVIIDFGWVSLQSQPQYFKLSDNTKSKYTQQNLYQHIAPECALLDEGTSTVSDVFQLGRLIRLIGARAADKDLLSVGEMCCHATAMFRPSILEVDQELDRLASSY